MDIIFTAENRAGERRELTAPDDMSLSLMEALNAWDYNIPATCGGMALCATCHVQILEGQEHLPIPNSDELDMLDTLPDATDTSRLACQLRINNTLTGAVFLVMHEDEA